jgi:hypothetical protein
LPLEYTLNLTYGEQEAALFPFLVDLRLKLQEETREKIDRESIPSSLSVVTEQGTLCKGKDMIQCGTLV